MHHVFGKRMSMHGNLRMHMLPDQRRGLSAYCAIAKRGALCTACRDAYMLHCSLSIPWPRNTQKYGGLPINQLSDRRLSIGKSFWTSGRKLPRIIVSLIFEICNLARIPCSACRQIYAPARVTSGRYPISRKARIMLPVSDLFRSDTFRVCLRSCRNCSRGRSCRYISL